MAAGFKYNLNTEPAVEELCRFDTVYRMAGGYNLEDKDLPNGSILPVLCPLSVDLKARKAEAVKNVRVSEDVAADARICNCHRTRQYHLFNLF